jgi:amino acid adenylation domain-containing protein
MTNIEPPIDEHSPSADTPRLLHEFFEKQVRLRPDHPAVECNGEVLTYSQLDQLGDHMASVLQARGIGPGSLVAIYLNKSCGLFAAILGILKAGAGYVPIDPMFPIGRVQSIVEDAGITTVITDGDLPTALAAEVDADVIMLNEELGRATQPSPLQRSSTVAPNDVCYVIYTSGSTGRPKGVVIEHRHAVNFVESLRTVYRLTPQDRVYQGFSIAFDASVEEVWAAFSIGGTLIVPASAIARSTIDAADFINLHNVTYFSTVPSFLALIKTDLPRVRLLVVGGEPCSAELVQRWVTPSRRMMNTYGPTEATVVATATDCIPGQPVTIGRPLPGYDVFVLANYGIGSSRVSKANSISAVPALRAAI